MKIFGAHGFDQVMTHAGIARTFAVGFLAPSGKCDDWDARAQFGFANPAGRFDTVHDRHSHVHQDDVRFEAFESLDGLRSVRDCLDFMSFDLEQHR